MGRRGLTGGGLLAAAALIVVLLLQGGDSANDVTTTQESTAPTTTAVQTLPGEAEGTVPADERAQVAATLALVEAGGPFPHEQDGATFFNREGLLPEQPEGHYREYTVETPGSDDRGARRLVIGEAGETFYTRDHYESFVRIEPEDFN